MGEDGRERSMRDPPILHPSLQPSQPSVGANDGGSGVGGGNGGGGGGGGRHGGATCKSAWRRDALPNAPLPLSFPAGWTRALRGRDSLVYPLSRHTHHGQNQTIDRQTGVPTLTPRGTRGRYFVPPVYQLASYSPQSVSVFPFLSTPPPSSAFSSPFLQPLLAYLLKNPRTTSSTVPYTFSILLSRYLVEYFVYSCRRCMASWNYLENFDRAF